MAGKHRMEKIILNKTTEETEGALHAVRCMPRHLAIPTLRTWASERERMDFLGERAASVFDTRVLAHAR